MEGSLGMFLRHVCYVLTLVKCKITTRSFFVKCCNFVVMRFRIVKYGSMGVVVVVVSAASDFFSCWWSCPWYPNLVPYQVQCWYVQYCTESGVGNSSQCAAIRTSSAARSFYIRVRELPSHLRIRHDPTRRNKVGSAMFGIMKIKLNIC